MLKSARSNASFPATPRTSIPGTTLIRTPASTVALAIPECPYEAIFDEDDVPDAYVATGGEWACMPAGTPGYDTPYTGTNHHGVEVNIASARQLEAGEELDLTPDI